MNRVVHFEMHADNPEETLKFYEKVFGWKSQKWEGPEPYWLITTGDENEPGINGGMAKRKDPAGNVYNTIQVSSVDETVTKIEENGGEIVVPRMAIPGVGYLAYFKDAEGNVSGIMHDDPSAK
jgi:predicted enzyme related to lactoylglutathione lyase